MRGFLSEFGRTILLGITFTHKRVPAMLEVQRMLDENHRLSAAFKQSPQSWGILGDCIA